MTNLATLKRPHSIFEGPYRLSIAGKLVGAKNSFDVFNPATGEMLAKAPSAIGRGLKLVLRLTHAITPDGTHRA